jgi:hypothetical protein
MTHKYILDGHTPIPEPDLIKWATWFETSGKLRLVAETTIAGAHVLTYFLGVDFSFERAAHAPILFETEVFGGPCHRDGERCSTWEEAEAMHARWVAKVQLPDPAGLGEQEESDE